MSKWFTRLFAGNNSVAEVDAILPLVTLGRLIESVAAANTAAKLFVLPASEAYAYRSLAVECNEFDEFEAATGELHEWGDNYLDKRRFAMCTHTVE